MKPTASNQKKSSTQGDNYSDKKIISNQNGFYLVEFLTDNKKSKYEGELDESERFHGFGEMTIYETNGNRNVYTGNWVCGEPEPNHQFSVWRHYPDDRKSRCFVGLLDKNRKFFEGKITDGTGYEISYKEGSMIDSKGDEFVRTKEGIKRKFNHKNVTPEKTQNKFQKREDGRRSPGSDNNLFRV